MGDDTLSAWMKHACTVLCQRDPRRGNAVENYCPITCLPIMWKLLTRVIAEEMYGYLEQEKILPEEEKGCTRGSRGTKDHLFIDKTVLKDCKKRHINLSMAYLSISGQTIRNKAYDFVPHSWINKSMELFGIADSVRNFLGKSMEQWKLPLTSNCEDLGVGLM